VLKIYYDFRIVKILILLEIELFGPHFFQGLNYYLEQKVLIISSWDYGILNLIDLGRHVGDRTRC
jgi:hypothetical protein